MAILISLLLLFNAAEATATPTPFSHDDWGQVLSRFVDEQGQVDYIALAADQEVFRRYISTIQTVGPTTNPELFPTNEDRLAYYLNAYNALVFDGVLSRGPESESVWKGGLVSGFSFFVSMKVVVDGGRTSLKKLEDDVVRKEFRDPRIHAALNCASKGCPRLPREPFDPAHLDEELDAAMREFVSSEQRVHVDSAARTVHLSKIFDWFTGDFLDYEKEQGNARPTLIDYINRYRAGDEQIPDGLKVKFLKYDKSINAV